MTRPARVRNLHGIGVDRVGDLADSRADRLLLRLENLDTDLPPPPAALAATLASVPQDRNNSYLPFLGQPNLRHAVAAHVSRLSGVPYTSAQVIISAGGLSGILNVLLTVIDNGDAVILTDPTYVGLINRVALAGGEPVLVPFLPSRGEWRLDRDALRAAITPRTRAFLLMSPSMPTGAWLDRADWECVASLAREFDLWVIYDAAMERILFDARPVIHPASLPGMHSRVITVGAASKELRMIGWRVGWIVAPESLIPDLSLVSMANVVTPVGIAQDAVAVALSSPIDSAVAAWQSRRDALLAELDGLPALRPAGGWSLLLDGGPLGLTGAEMAARLLREAHIAATPMDGWGVRNGSRFLRFVFSNEPVERLHGAGDRIRRALAVP